MNSKRNITVVRQWKVCLLLLILHAGMLDAPAQNSKDSEPKSKVSRGPAGQKNALTPTPTPKQELPAKATTQASPASRDGSKDRDDGVPADKGRTGTDTTSLQNPNPNNTERGNDVDDEEVASIWWTVGWWLLWIALTAVIVGIVLWIIIYLKKRNYHEKDRVNSEFQRLRQNVRAIDLKIESIQSVVNELGQKISRQQIELGKLRQDLQEDIAKSTPPPYDPPIPVPVEAPRFPVAVEEYLKRFQSGGIPVKYEYKEGMLVVDPVNEGGLLIVQDEGKLYLTPGFGFLQTKSAFTNYYERFFQCDRPMPGIMWIKRPCVVSQVPGGWDITEMGEIEIR